ncbi:MAG: hypothetical protein KDE31_13445, partial [Caldilineaceae bacterium]|nr:hypothetical protein [Caldilineaceae bacterium]
AAMTGAAVIPVECMLDASGRICVRFFPALHGCSDASQTMVLVEQYVAHLEQMWCSAPENIATKRLRDYLYGSREYIVSP